VSDDKCPATESCREAVYARKGPELSVAGHLSSLSEALSSQSSGPLCPEFPELELFETGTQSRIYLKLGSVLVHVISYIVSGLQRLHSTRVA
jgi:hypothetical protein